MKTVEERLSQMETRFTRLEALVVSLGNRVVGKSSLPAVTTSNREVHASPIPSTPSRPSSPPISEARELSVTQVLGWTGATALVLAMAYLIRLALDTGWLTPERQLALAVLTGFSLIGAGLRLRASDREYASLLPAGGMVVLFLSIYGAHLYYHLISGQLAAGTVIVSCLGVLWLGRLFESEIYGLFAVVGSYSAPFLLPALAGSVTDLVIYYSAWSVLFCLYAVWIGNRRAYLLAAYMALLGFHFLWRKMAPDAWTGAFLFQAVQFITFLGGAVTFSIRHDRPMEQNEAIAHLPLLLIFYALQYGLLQTHLPGPAPWIALGSSAVLVLVYFVARKIMAKPLESGALLVGAYAALALFHAGYMELVPEDSAPWVALLVLPAAGVYFLVRGEGASVTWPIRALIGIIFAINYLRVIADSSVETVPAHKLLALLYAVELYVAYYLVGRLPSLIRLATPSLYTGHVALMGAAVRIIDNRVGVSLAWGTISLACLALAFRYKDKVLGKSSLLIFAASAAKVLLFDLSSATPLVRIGSLVILGVTLYVGGWMYKKVDVMEASRPQLST